MSEGMSLGQLTAKLGLNSASLEAGAGKAKQVLKGIGADAERSAGGLQGAFAKAAPMVAAGIAAIGVAAAAFAIKSAGVFKDVGLEVIKLQRFTGGSAEEMSKWRFAAQQSGVDADKMANSMKFLSKAVDGNKPAFEKYGIATVDANGKTLPLREIMLRTSDVFKNMPNGVEKTALAVQLFGRSGTDMIPMLSKGRVELERLEKQAQKYGLVLSKDNLDAIKANMAAHREQTAAMQGFQVQIGQHVLPVLTKLTKAFAEGLVVVMPLVSGIINSTVVPALSLLTSMLTGTLHFVESHQGPVKVLAGVIAAALVPALLAWAAAQAKAIATSVVEFLAVMATNAVRAAGSMNLMSGSLEAGTAKMTGMGTAVTGAVAVLGLLYMEWQRQKSAAKEWADKLVESAKSPEEATNKLREAQERYRGEMNAGVNVLGLHMFATDGDAKKAGIAAQRYKEVTDKLKEQSQATDTATDAADQLAAGFTQSGLAVQTLGGKMNLTADQVRELAASMKIDLSKATSDETAKLTEQAQRLGVTKVSTLKLADANKTLSDWTKDITAKTSAFSAALDALISDEVSAERSTINYQDRLAALTDAMPKSTAGMAASAEARQKVATATQSLHEKERALTVLLATGKADATAVAGARQDIAEATAALKKANEEVAPTLRTGAQLFDAHTAKGRETEGMLLDLIDATVADTGAVYKQSGSMDQAKAAFNNHVGDLRRVMQQSGMTTQQIEEMIRKYHLTPDRIDTIVGMTDKATPPLQNVQRQIDQVKQPVAPTVTVQDRASGPLDNIISKLKSVASFGLSTATFGLSNLITGHADGAIVRAPEIAALGEGYKPEVVVPMTNPGRARQLLTEAGMQDLFTGAAGSSSGATGRPAPAVAAGGRGGDVTVNAPITHLSNADPDEIAGAIHWRYKTAGT